MHVDDVSTASHVLVRSRVFDYSLQRKCVICFDCPERSDWILGASSFSFSLS